METHLKSQEAKSRTQLHTAAAVVSSLRPDENNHLIPLESCSLSLKFQVESISTVFLKIFTMRQRIFLIWVDFTIIPSFLLKLTGGKKST